MAIKKKAVTKKKVAKKKVVAKKRAVSKKKVAAKKKTAAKKRGRVAAKKTAQVHKMSKPSIRTQGSSSIAPSIPPGFQGNFEEEAVLEPFVVTHQATRRSKSSNTPASHWSKLEPMAPPSKVEEAVEESVEVEAEPRVPTTLIEQVLIESQSYSKRPFAIQPRFTKPVEEEVVEEVAAAPAPVVAAQKKTDLSEYLSIWGGQPQPERQAVVEQIMVEASTDTEQRAVEDSAVTVAVEEPPISIDTPAVEEPAIENTISKPAPDEEVATPLASRPSMLDAVHAVATQAQQQRTTVESEQSERMAEPVSHTDQVAEVIRMIEEEEKVVDEQEHVLKSATETDPKGDFSAEIQAAVEEEESEEIDDPHFNEALDKISGTRADDSEALQRREAIRHFTESAAKKRKERRNRVATGAPAIVGGLPARATPKDTRVEVESLGGGVMHLLSSGVKGVASIGRYSLKGIKYGLEDSKSALGKITSKS